MVASSSNTFCVNYVKDLTQQTPPPTMSGLSAHPAATALLQLALSAQWKELVPPVNRSLESSLVGQSLLSFTVPDFLRQSSSNAT
jgi:hypothetical protein